MKSLKIGISFAGVLHTDAEFPDVETRFRWASEAKVFDYVDRTPPAGELERYLRASERYGLALELGVLLAPVTVGSALFTAFMALGATRGSVGSSCV